MEDTNDIEQLIFYGAIVDSINIGGYSFKLTTLSMYKKKRMHEKIDFLPINVIPMISKIEILKLSIISINGSNDVEIDILQEVIIERLFEYYLELENRADKASELSKIKEFAELPGHWIKWRLVQMFGVPIDSDVIKNINQAQMIWYAMMFNKEREENFDSELNMTEYLASFINSEAVKQTRDARDNKKTVTDDDFEIGLRKTFGRDLSKEAVENGSRIVAEEKQAAVAPKKRKGEISIEDIKKYTNLELDDVKFIPNKNK